MSGPQAPSVPRESSRVCALEPTPSSTGGEARLAPLLQPTTWPGPPQIHTAEPNAHGEGVGLGPGGNRIRREGRRRPQRAPRPSPVPARSDKSASVGQEAGAARHPAGCPHLDRHFRPPEPTGAAVRPASLRCQCGPSRPRRRPRVSLRPGTGFRTGIFVSVSWFGAFVKTQVTRVRLLLDWPHPVAVWMTVALEEGSESGGVRFPPGFEVSFLVFCVSIRIRVSSWF